MVRVTLHLFDGAGEHSDLAEQRIEFLDCEDDWVVCLDENVLTRL